MASHVCGIVPPHLLDALAANGTPEAKQLALKTLSHTHDFRSQRKEHFERKTIGYNTASHNGVAESIVPDQILENVVTSKDADPSSKEAAQKSLEVNHQIWDGLVSTVSAIPEAKMSAAIHRLVYDMQNLEQKIDKDDQTYLMLPGKLIRSEGEPPISDEHANQAYDNCAKVIDFYKQVFGYTFLDDASLPVISSIHFEKGYQNAQWIGSSTRQMVYGDGGHNLYNFTACLDVIGHEMTHAVTEHTCHLLYEGESGALNEHISDVFGMMATLWDSKKATAESDWLIGEGCLMPGIKGVALRNMKFPGTAYDDPVFGTDLQPGSWADLVAFKTKHKYWATYDHGCVHAFSGIPNRAFVLTAEAFAGFCWEKAGKIWWIVVTTNRVPPNCSFVQFADATVDVADKLFGADASKIVRAAWDEVGIVRSG